MDEMMAKSQFKSMIQAKIIRLGLVIMVMTTGGLLSACGHHIKATHKTDMAASIYTELAQYYWQHGYYALAKNRLHLALKQNPNYAPALLLKKQWL